MNSNPPVARYQDIVVQELKDEVLICNLQNNRVFCLNKTAAEVWKLCDGKNDISKINEKLSQKINAKVTDDLIWLTIEKLSSLELLTERVEIDQFKNYNSRRDVIKKIGLATMAALPLVSVLVMPTATSAQSGLQCPVGNPNPAGCPCNTGVDCASGCCLENFPDAPICGPTFGERGCFCSSNFDCDTNNFTCCAPANPVCNPGC